MNTLLPMVSHILFSLGAELAIYFDIFREICRGRGEAAPQDKRFILRLRSMHG